MSHVCKCHPQQGPNECVDDRATQPSDFAVFHARFKFTIDVCASHHNAKLPRYYTKDSDGLAQSWRGERVWCNPPYSSIRPWVEKALQREAELSVLLLPANRTEQKWWQTMIEPRRHDPHVDDYVRVEFLPGRMKFIAPGDDRVMPNNRPPFGVCLVIIEQR